jgi:hypothetical protein
MHVKQETLLKVLKGQNGRAYSVKTYFMGKKTYDRTNGVISHIIF